jgi:EAL domain-containing protein (putative c-di-GMP-specific phosphodiesterase class I)
MLVNLLRLMGAKAVYSADDGQAALQVLRDPDRKVDIVVSDLSMPGMDGMEFIRHLSEIGDRVSIILASSLDRDLLVSIAHMANAYKVKLLGVIGKPPTASKLAPMIELYRLGAAHSDQGEAAFALAEIVDAWTHNEFEPWFEPKINLRTGSVHGMHADPRWRHPVKGLLKPQDFMPSLQARGLNDDFVWLMLQKCAAQCQEWRSRGLELVVSVNLAFDSFTDVNLASRVRHTVASEGLEPRYIVLSFNEAALKTDVAKTLENLARLRVDGFGLAIDDFGSGPMAVDQLSLVAFTEMKISSAFVSGSRTSESVRAGLAVSLETAQMLKLKAVADGIQSKEEWQLLHEWQCDLGQGPFIAAPLKGDSVPTWVASWKGSRIQ